MHIHNETDTQCAMSESIVELALEKLKKKPSYELPRPIISFEHAERYSELDQKKHTDFLVVLDGDYEIPLQVKSSERGKKKFEKKCLKWGVFIPVVVAKVGDSLELVIRQVIRCIRRVFYTIHRATKKHFTNDDAFRKLDVLKPRKREKCRRFHAPCMCH